MLFFFIVFTLIVF